MPGCHVRPLPQPAAAVPGMNVLGRALHAFDWLLNAMAGFGGGRFRNAPDQRFSAAAVLMPGLALAHRVPAALELPTIGSSLGIPVDERVP